MEKKLQTIIDNREPNTALESLKRLLPESKTLDVATGYFEIGSPLALDSFWNALEAWLKSGYYYSGGTVHTVPRAML